MIESFSWLLRFGDKVKQLEALQKKQGKQPKALKDRPEQNVVVDWFLNAFFVLKATTGDSGKISLVEIKAFAEIYGLIVTIEEFIEIIQAMNKEFLERSKNG